MRKSSETNRHTETDVPDLVMDAETRIYKVKPFGLDESVNMRNLNPNGKSPYATRRLTELKLLQTWTKW